MQPNNRSPSKVTPAGAAPGTITFFNSFTRFVRGVATRMSSPRGSITSDSSNSGASTPPSSPKLLTSKNRSKIESALNDLQEVNPYLHQLNALESSQDDNEAYESNRIVIDYLLLSNPKSLTECSHIIKRFNPQATNTEAPPGSRLSPKIEGLKSCVQATFFLDHFLLYLIDREILKQKNIGQSTEKKNQNEILYEYLQSMILKFRAENQDIQKKCDEIEDSVYDKLDNPSLSSHSTATFFSSAAKLEKKNDDEHSVGESSDADSDENSEDRSSIASRSSC